MGIVYCNCMEVVIRISMVQIEFILTYRLSSWSVTSTSINAGRLDALAVSDELRATQQAIKGRAIMQTRSRHHGWRILSHSSAALVRIFGGREHNRVAEKHIHGSHACLASLPIHLVSSIALNMQSAIGKSSTYCKGHEVDSIITAVREHIGRHTTRQGIKTRLEVWHRPHLQKTIGAQELRECVRVKPDTGI
jgi:hypothetical protein